MKQVWMGLLEVSQIPGDQVIELSQGAAFTWFTCWAETAEQFEAKAIEVMRHYGLNILGCEGVLIALDQIDIGEELHEQVERTQVSENNCLYGTFHGYPPRHF